MRSSQFQPLCTNILVALLMVTIAVKTASAANSNTGNNTDYVALLAFKSNIMDDPYGVLNSWNDSSHFCEWQGVKCGNRHTRVTALDLTSSGLVGSLSPYIGNLTFLRVLSLENNTFQREISPEIGRLFRQRSIWLYNNSLEGEIPTNLSQLTSLVHLSIGNNKLVGKIPRELGDLSKLTFFSVLGNYLRGEIPSSIGNLTGLEILSGTINVLEGNIPDTLGQLRKLRVLGLGENKLSGIVPLSIYNLSSLTLLSLIDNQLRGSLSQNLGTSLPNLRYIQIWENQFNGTLPVSLSNASRLEVVSFGMNNFVGKVPTDLGRLQRLRLFFLEFNNLGSGEADDMNFINSMVNCTALEKLALISNQFGGTLPRSLGNLSTQLRYFGVRGNQISGVIPFGFRYLIYLERIEMGHNNFQGQIPDEIGELQKLQQLHLGTNRLSGQIPFSLGNLFFLSLVNLEQNELEGTIPSSLGNCRNLIRMNVSQNHLSGTIPKELFSASALSISLNLARNNLAGPLPSEVGNLKHLVELDVSENQLSSEIPIQLGSCIGLMKLSLGHNFFNCSIPPSFKSLKSIQNLDLSSNSLSGTVPLFLEDFSLQNLNLSYNDLEGELPTKGVFKNICAISVVGNNGLCGGVSKLHLPKCNSDSSSKQRRLRLQHIILIIVGCLVLVSYGDLLKATNGFSSTNLIGVGSFGAVYKGILEHEKTEIAVKVLNLHRRGASKSFMAECEALRNLHHRNLVKIVTSCSSIDFHGNDFKALVYEFMPKGSLEKWINSRDIQQDELLYLNLGQRIDIAIDVACALNYLHHHCGKPILHCDLKPSNILLDNDMVAHVGDFGLAKFPFLRLSNGNESTSIGIRGTVGYTAPEYGLGSEISMKGDVYSYGVLLLEMMTGRKPIDGMIYEGLNLRNIVTKALPDHLMEVVEPKLLLVEKEDGAKREFDNKQSTKKIKNGNQIHNCLIAMLRIGLACSMESPQDRMDINDVIHELFSDRGIVT
ncbi:hypothetical protein LguiB_014209 [Lonicera macranthoides]